ncbi:MAG: nucleoside hydrolase [Clostridia bacterium]|nr:nucleoside hydrolase [Clostridia bacterium]
MKRLLGIAVVALCLAACTSAGPGKEIVDLIFETDMGNDIDDALALDMIFKYQDAGLVNLLGIGINKESNDDRMWPAEFADIMCTWYGYPDTPIGLLRHGAYCDDGSNYTRDVALMTDANGNPLFARTVKDYEALPEVPALYRRILAARPDSSVTMVSVGFSTNIAALLDTPGDEVSPLTGRELVARKVKLLSVMGGKIIDGSYHEYNIVRDIPAAQKVFSEWPSPIVVSPFEVGTAILYPGSAVETGFDWAEGPHPAVEAYRHYHEMPYDRPSWDMTSVLCAVEGPSYFTVSPAGNIEIDDEGGMTFTEDENGSRFYLSVTGEQADAILSRLVELTTSVPRNRR